jgi:hypothetical protein
MFNNTLQGTFFYSTIITLKESNKKKLNTPVKGNFCKNLFQTPKSNQNEGNDFENDEIQMEVCCPSGNEISPFGTAQFTLDFNGSKKTSLRCSIPNLSKVADPGHFP